MIQNSTTTGQNPQQRNNSVSVNQMRSGGLNNKRLGGQGAANALNGNQAKRRVENLARTGTEYPMTKQTV